MRYQALFLSMALVLALGCGGSSKRADDMPTPKPEQVSDEPVDMDEVDPSQLGDSPCANPNWSRPPDAEPAPEDR